MSASKFMKELQDFCTTWKRELLRDVTSQYKRKTLESFLSDDQSAFKVLSKPASRTFVSESQQRYKIKRYWQDGLLHPLWKILAASFDQSRTPALQKKIVDSFQGFTVYWTDNNEATPDTVTAVLYMIEVQLPLKERVLRGKCSPRNNSRVPTHRRNGELYMNGRKL